MSKITKKPITAEELKDSLLANTDFDGASAWKAIEANTRENGVKYILGLYTHDSVCDDDTMELFTVTTTGIAGVHAIADALCDFYSGIEIH